MAEEEGMVEARIIKRYANRKLYDTQHSRYVTLDQISEMIRNGDDVKIVDNKTKEDLTSVTLAQIIFEEEKKQRSFLPLQAMRNIIQNGGEQFAQFVFEAQRRMKSVLPRKREGEEGEEEDFEGEIHDLEVADDETYGGKKLGSITELREWVQQSQKTIEEWQTRVDGRIRNAVGAITPFAGLHKDVKTLGDRIAELESKLEKLAEAERAQKAEAAAEATDEAEADDAEGEATPTKKVEQGG